MGANFETITLPGTLDRAEVEKRFAEAQDQDRYENGNSYSGGIGMASGLSLEDREFADGAAAYDYLDVTCEKWSRAIAVKYRVENHTNWMIGALCAS